MKKLIALILSAFLLLSLTACGKEQTPEAPAEKETVNVFMISGPTGIGAVNLMKAAKENTAADNYNFTVVAEPTEIVTKISNGEADIAAVATNLASNIYNKTNGGVTVLAVNTLGVLNVITNGDTAVNSIADLKGKTVYTTGKGANPEYVINYLLEKNGLTPSDLTLEFIVDGKDLVPVFAQNPNAVIIAPQPVASSITAKYNTSKIALDLTDEWEKVGEGSALMMGCVIVRNEFLAAHPDAVTRFMGEYEASVKAVSENIDATAALCEEYGIVAAAAIAKKAIPNCNICFITGQEMQTKLSGYLNVLFTANPKSVGGKLPEANFYYNK